MVNKGSETSGWDLASVSENERGCPELAVWTRASIHFSFHAKNLMPRPFLERGRLVLKNY